MTESFASLPDHAVVEEDGYLTLVELSRACRAPEAQIHVWVIDGVLAPLGQQPGEWRFAAPRPARLAAHARPGDQRARGCTRARPARRNRHAAGRAAAALWRLSTNSPPQRRRERRQASPPHVAHGLFALPT